MDLELLGLPLHPLIVHATVVFVPLAALALVAGTFVPVVRRRLGIATPILALVALVLTPLTILSGEALRDRVGPVPSVLAHEDLGRMLPPWTIALFVVAAAQWTWFRIRAAAREDGAGGRAPWVTRATTIAFAAAAVVTAAGAMTMVVLIGESGARSVWGG